MALNNQFENWYNKNSRRILNTVCEYLSIDTVTPNEDSAFNFLKKYLNGIDYTIKKQKFNEKLKDHELYTPCSYSQETIRNNYIAIPNKVDNNLFKTVFNIHTDVVPASEKDQKAFEPYASNGYIYGRGACDTKTNFIALCEAIRYLLNNNIPIKKNVEIHLPVEEEETGNGTLSLVLNGVKADEIIDMEPTNLIVFAGHRGCITTNIETSGNPVHMGGQTKEVSAIDIALDVISQLKNLEKKLLQEAKDIKCFSCWEKPLKINIGIIKGGEWPGSIPAKCEITSNVGFLTNYNLNDMKKILTECCINGLEESKQKYVTVKFNGLKNNAYYCNEKTKLIDCANENGITQDNNTYGWIVSCDASIYYDQLKIPTYIWGCGDLSDAHSAHERVEIEQIKKEIEVLVDYLSH